MLSKNQVNLTSQTEKSAIFLKKFQEITPPHAKLLDNLFSLCYNVVYELCDFWIKTKFLEVATLLYLAEGNRTEACISAIAMIPIVGTGATTAKLSKNALKATDTIADIATDGRKVADAVVDSADLARDANKVRKLLWVPKEVNGRIVYQRDDLFEWMPENIAKMRDGKAPKGVNGEPIQLHHLLQREPGSLAEIDPTLHGKVPHKQLNAGESFRNNPELKQSYKNYRENYWKTRVLDNPNQ